AERRYPVSQSCAFEVSRWLLPRAQHVEPPGGESDSCRSQECAAISGLVRRHVGVSVNTGEIIRYARRTSVLVSRRQGISSIGLWYRQSSLSARLGPMSTHTRAA